MAKNIVVTEDENASGTLVTSSKLGELKVAQLRTLAQQLGIKGYLRLKKADLVEAVASHQRGGVVAERDETDAEKRAKRPKKLLPLRLKSPKRVRARRHPQSEPAPRVPVKRRRLRKPKRPLRRMRTFLPWT